MNPRGRQTRLQAGALPDGSWGLVKRPTPEAYARALSRTPISQELQRALAAQVRADDAPLSEIAICRIAGWKYNRRTGSAFRSQYGKLGHRISNELGLPPALEDLAKRSGWPDTVWTYAIAASRSRPFRWMLYPEFIEGLKLSGYLNREVIEEPDDGTLPEQDEDEDSELAPLSPRGAGYTDSESRREVERKAVTYVTRNYRKDGWRVKSKEREKDVGYDLECVRAGESRHVEVKGVSGAALNFSITEGEVKVSKRDPAWRIAVVTNALSKKAMLMQYNGQQFRQIFRLAPIAYWAKLKTDPLDW